MKMQLTWVFAILVWAIVALPPQAGEAKKDTDSIQGTWAGVSFVQDLLRGLLLEKNPRLLQIILTPFRVQPVGVELVEMFVGQGTQQLIDFTDRLPALSGVGAADVARNVLA